MKFGYSASYYDMERAGVKVFAEKYGKKRFCAMSQDTDYGRDVMDGVRDQLKAMNMQLVAETLHKPTDTDFSAAVAKLRDADCDVILLGTIVRDTVQIVSALRKVGWHVDILGNEPIYDQSVADVPGGATEGIYTMTATLYVDPNDPRPAVHAFATNYEKLYGHPPTLQRRSAILRRNSWLWRCRRRAGISQPKASLPRWRVSKITTISSALRQ